MYKTFNKQLSVTDYFMKAITWNTKKNMLIAYVFTDNNLLIYESNDLSTTPFLTDKIELTKEQVSSIKRFVFSDEDINKHHFVGSYVKQTDLSNIYEVRGYFKIHGKNKFATKKIKGYSNLDGTILQIFRLISIC